MGLFDDDDVLFGKKTFSGFDRIGVSQGKRDLMNSVNRYNAGFFNHGLDGGQQLQAESASNEIDLLFMNKPEKSNRLW